MPANKIERLYFKKVFFEIWFYCTVYPLDRTGYNTVTKNFVLGNHENLHDFNETLTNNPHMINITETDVTQFQYERLETVLNSDEWTSMTADYFTALFANAIEIKKKDDPADHKRRIIMSCQLCTHVVYQ